MLKVKSEHGALITRINIAQLGENATINDVKEMFQRKSRLIATLNLTIDLY